MENDKVGIFDAVTSQYAIWRGVLTRAAGLFEQLTFRIPQGSSTETIAQLSQRWRLSEEKRQYLVGLCSEKVGATFFADKIEEMNRAALHRSAFALNAVTHLLFVDVGAQLYLSLPQIKLMAPPPYSAAACLSGTRCATRGATSSLNSFSERCQACGFSR